MGVTPHPHTLLNPCNLPHYIVELGQLLFFVFPNTLTPTAHLNKLLLLLPCAEPILHLYTLPNYNRS